MKVFTLPTTDGDRYDALLACTKVNCTAWKGKARQVDGEGPA